MWTRSSNIHPCEYCGRHDRCYRFEIRFICTEAFNCLPDFALIKYVLNNVCDDVRLEIMTLYKLIKNPCVLSKNSVIKKRKEYLDYDYTLLSLRELQELTVHRCSNLNKKYLNQNNKIQKCSNISRQDVKIKRTRDKKYYYELLNHDINNKKQEWKHDRYYEDF